MSALAEWALWSRRPPDRLKLEVLDDVPRPLPAHVGLFLDRCLVEPDSGRSEHPGRAALYRAAVEALKVGGLAEGPAVANYRPRYQSHLRSARNPPPGVMRKVVQVETMGRVLLHPATDSTVTEAGLLLHHTYGVPYLPGSALKGLCRSRVARCLGESASAGRGLIDDLLGWSGKEEDPDRASLIDFWDALWVPEGKDGSSPLMLDLVNPHHPDYYTGKGDRSFPSPADNPIPVHFVSIRPGTRFLLVLDASQSEGGMLADWFAWVVRHLLIALEEEGLGAKVTAGYGRLQAVDPADRPARETKEDGTAKAGGPATVPTATGAVAPVRAIAWLSREKSDGSLMARLEDGAMAVARGELAAKLHRDLSDQTRERLKRNKPVQVHVTWMAEGNARRLVGIDESPP